jgi:hypothetical protein
VARQIPRLAGLFIAYPPHVGDSYDNVLVELINGFVQGVLIRRKAPWKTRTSAELAILGWVSCLTTDGYSNRSATFRRLKRRQTYLQLSQNATVEG